MMFVDSLLLDTASDLIADDYGFASVSVECELAGGMFARPVLLKTNRGLFVRRVHTFRNTEQAFRFQAEAIEFAAQQGVICSRVEPTLRGEWCIPVGPDNGVAALHQFVEGRCDDWTTWHRRKRTQSGFMHALGRQVADLHNALAKAAPKGDPELRISLPPIQFSHLDRIRAEWREEVVNLRRRQNCVAESSRDQLLSLSGRIELHWERLATAVAGVQLGELPVQIVHGDVSPVNMVFDSGNRVAFIDWDCVHVGHRMYDALGDVLNRPPHDRPDWNRFVRGEVEAYVDGYASRLDVPLTALEQQMLPAFCLARQLEDLRQRLCTVPELDVSHDEKHATLIGMRVEMMDQIELN